MTDGDYVSVFDSPATPGMVNDPPGHDLLPTWDLFVIPVTFDCL